MHARARFAGRRWRKRGGASGGRAPSPGSQWTAVSGQRQGAPCVIAACAAFAGTPIDGICEQHNSVVWKLDQIVGAIIEVQNKSVLDARPCSVL